MKEPSCVYVVGPLEEFAEGFGCELVRQGYSKWTANALMYLTLDVSAWLAANGVEPGDLDSGNIEAFLVHRRASGSVRRLTPRGLIPLLGYLRGLGVIPAKGPARPENAVERLLEQFGVYLVDERGLAARTIDGYRRVAARFLSACSWTVDDDGVSNVTAANVNAFVLSECQHRNVGDVSNMVTALRALLRFLHVAGYVPVSLAASLPTAPNWTGRGAVAPVLDAGQVERLLESCDRRTPAGRRDFAILTMLYRLGLRANEVASLNVEDIDWRAGQLQVVGKGNRHDCLPLPVDVGEAIVDYCKHGRRSGACRNLFVLVRAPYTALSSSTVSCVVERACERAGLPPVRAHRLRHAAASEMRRGGAPLFEIGQILRHTHTKTTALYARDDLTALAVIARTWSGPTS
jgi:integrase/recombinase XerD